MLQGGTLIQYEGKLRLLEVAQVAQERLEDFMSVKKFNVFNTNNLWISLPAIRRVVRTSSTWRAPRYLDIYLLQHLLEGYREPRDPGLRQ